MRQARAWAGFLVAVLVAGACSDPLDAVRQKNTAEAYRIFAREYPDHPRLAEAKRLEMEAAFRGLSQKPKVSELSFFLEHYPDSPMKGQVQAILFEMGIEKLLSERNLPALGRALKECPDQALAQRVREAIEYLTGARKAMYMLDEGFFKGYLEKHQGGEYSSHAQQLLKWMEGLDVKPQLKLPVVVEGPLSAEHRAHIARRFSSLKATPEFRRGLGELKEYEGRLVYRVSEISKGEQRQIFNDDGELVEFTAPGSGVIVEILTVKEGKVSPLWQWATGKMGGVETLDFPVFTWDTRSVVLSEVRASTTVGYLTDLGRFLLATTLDGFELYDPTFPDQLRRVYTYTRPDGQRVRSADARVEVAVSGKLVALYGDGVELVDCNSLQDLRRNSVAGFHAVGPVISGAWVGEYFFFINKEGSLYEMNMDSQAPKLIGIGSSTMLSSGAKGQLVVGGEDGLAFYRVSADGALGERDSLPFEEFPDGFNLSVALTDMVKTARGTLVSNARGEITLLADGKIDTSFLTIDDVGPIVRFDAEGGWLASIGDFGLALRLHGRFNSRWRFLGAVPITRCQAVNLRYPLAYLACGDRIRTVHLKALYRQQ